MHVPIVRSRHLTIVRVTRSYTIGIKYLTSQTNLPCLSSEARTIAFTVLVALSMNILK